MPRRDSLISSVTPRSPLLATVLASLLVAGCTGTSAPEVSFPAEFVSLGTNEFVVDDIDIVLDEAKVAFGPIYFCASASGSATLCAVSLGEIRRVTLLDALSPLPQSLGTYEGYSGDVRSASFDYGIHWFLPDQDHTVSSRAPGGHSARLRGSATREGQTLRFEADIDLVPLFQGQRAVPTASAEGHVDDRTTRIDVTFDVAAWLSTVDFAAALDEGADPFVIAPGARDHDAVVIRMTSTRPPSFSFVAGDAK